MKNFICVAFYKTLREFVLRLYKGIVKNIENYSDDKLMNVSENIGNTKITGILMIYLID